MIVLSIMVKCRKPTKNELNKHKIEKLVGNKKKENTFTVRVQKAEKIAGVRMRSMDSLEFASRSVSGSPRGANPTGISPATPSSINYNTNRNDRGYDFASVEIATVNTSINTSNNTGETAEVGVLTKTTTKKLLQVLQNDIKNIEQIETGVSDKNVTVEERLKIIATIQSRLVKKRYKCPWYCYYVSNWCIILWSIGCGIITTLWCLWFDIMIDAKISDELELSVLSECEDSEKYIDIPVKSWLNYNGTSNAVSVINGSF